MILYRYILKNHFVPFVFSIVTLIGIFVLQFMMKFADRLVGKGLSIWVIIKLITYNLAWMLVLVVPMASLVATLMAFGNMSQNNEVTILKSSGVSLYKMMAAPLLASIVVGYLLLMFNNDVLPDANHQAKILMQDISRQKPTLSLVPGVFSQEIPNYAILARGIDQKSNDLTDVTLYDYTNPTKINIVTAEKGKIYFSANQSKLIMDLWKGEIHESNSAQTNLYRKLEFQKHRIAMPADQFTFQQSAPGQPRGDRELSTDAMLTIIDSLKLLHVKYSNTLGKQTKRYLTLDSASYVTASVPKSNQIDAIYLSAIEKLKTIKNIIRSNTQRVEFNQDQMNSYWVEVYKKYALPFACIIFVLIGAPLGVMVRKGGFGVAASISLFFFLLYWAFLIGGEKLGNRNMLPPFFGMWAANILIGIAGTILTIKTVRETVTINFSSLKRFIPKQWLTEEEDYENS
ncbi:MAG: LptF/LptG family permease [Ignavibacteriaceae bacterium]